MDGVFLIPYEFEAFGIYFAPLFIAAVLGVVLTALLAAQLNRFRLSRYFLNPALAFLCLASILTCIIATWIVPS